MTGRALYLCAITSICAFMLLLISACNDGKDENNTDGGDSACNDGEFTCDNGECILKAYVKDGMPDCTDDSDESESGNNGCCSTDSDCSGYERCVMTDDPECGQCRCPSDYECCSNTDCYGDLCDWSNKDGKAVCQCDHCGDINYPCKTDVGCQIGLECNGFTFSDAEAGKSEFSMCTKKCLNDSDCLGFDTATGWESDCAEIGSASYCIAYCYDDSDCPMSLETCYKGETSEKGFCAP